MRWCVLLLAGMVMLSCAEIYTDDEYCFYLAEVHVLAPRVLRPNNIFPVHIQMFNFTGQRNINVSIISRSDGRADSDMVKQKMVLQPGQRLTLELHEEALTVLRDRSLVLIQFDKPIYKPGDTIKYQILIVDQTLLPVGTAINIAIKNPKGTLTPHKREKVPPSYSQHPGFVEGSYKLGAHDMLGEWSMEVTIGHQVETRHFRVAEYVLPRFLLNISPPLFIHAGQAKFEVGVKASRPFGVEFMDMETNFNATITGPTGLTETKLYKGIYGEVFFATRTDQITGNFCKGRTVSEPVQGTVHFSVTALEIETGKSITKNTSIPFLCDPFVLNVRRNLLFHPGIPYNLTVEILQHDGQPYEGDLTAETIRWGVLYSDEVSNASSAALVTGQTVPIGLGNQAQIVLTPQAKHQKMDLILQLKNVKRNVTVYGFLSESRKYMSLQQTHSPTKVQPGQLIYFRVNCTERCDSVKYMILSKGSIVDSGERMIQPAKMEVSVKVTRGMAPTSTLVLYYHWPHCNGQVIVASAEFSVDGLVQNSVDLSVTPSTGATFAQPGREPKEMANLTVKNLQMGSLVGTIAVDERLLHMAGKSHILSNERALLGLLELEKERQFEASQHYPAHTPTLHSVSDIFKTSGLISIVLEKPTEFGVYDTVGNPNENNNPIGKGDSSVISIRSIARTFVMLSSSASFHQLNGRPECFGGRSRFPHNLDVLRVLAAQHLRTRLCQTSCKAARLSELFVDIECPYNMIRNETVTLEVYVTQHLSHSEAIILHLSIVFDEDDSPVEFSGMDDGVFKNTSVKNGKIWKGPKLHIPIGWSVRSKSERKASREKGRLSRGQSYRVKTLTVPINVSALSSTFVDGTLKLKIAVYGGEWTPVVTALTTSGKEFDGLIQLPSSCGEQNMAKLMPNIYVAHYLDKMGVLGQRRKWAKKLQYNIKMGYENQFSYQLDDGSFSAWGKQQKEVPGSTWLTAFVLRGFSEGKDWIKSSDIRNLSSSFRFLEERQAANGSFVEKGFLIEREKAGFAVEGAALTAFVALAFVEAGQNGLALDKAKNHLLSVQAQIERFPYTQAIVTYALAKLKALEAQGAATKLASLGVSNGEMKSWGGTSVSALTVEATSYAILAFEELGRFNDTKPGLRWLQSIKRDINGGFISTQDTVVALAALNKVAERGRASEQKLTATITYLPSNEKWEQNVDPTNALLYDTHAVPSDTSSIVVTAVGTGSASAQLSYFYNEIPTLQAIPTISKDKFKWNVTVQHDSTKTKILVVKISYAGNEPAGIKGELILTAEALTGYQFDNNILYLLQGESNLNVANVELEAKSSKLIIYFTKLGHEEKEFRLGLRTTNAVVQAQNQEPLVCDYSGKQADMAVCGGGRNWTYSCV
ncbi:CD109 antigen [Hypsibius exemplaris]|uniref:CD109 antigen n=1 Tax=Hypsibius exemplaris TaxID=2072580 RepID=A0A9X6RM37_HYPEX|nr:CD109 antigen [Hypsibius exemplaris]